MYRNIMIPLDGSKLAECVLPHVESVIKGCETPRITLIRVVEPVHLPVGTESDGGGVFTEEDAKRIREESDERNAAEAKDYLDRIASNPFFKGAEVTVEVLKGKPPKTIAHYAESNDIDLIVIATHGLSGISRWVWGSVADRILRAACVPVLMVRAPGCVPGV